MHKYIHTYIQTPTHTHTHTDSYMSKFLKAYLQAYICRWIFHCAKPGYAGCLAGWMFSKFFKLDLNTQALQHNTFSCSSCFIECCSIYFYKASAFPLHHPVALFHTPTAGGCLPPYSFYFSINRTKVFFVFVLNTYHFQYRFLF